MASESVERVGQTDHARNEAMREMSRIRRNRLERQCQTTITTTLIALKQSIEATGALKLPPKMVLPPRDSLRLIS